MTANQAYKKLFLQEVATHLDVTAFFGTFKLEDVQISTRPQNNQHMEYSF